MKTIPVIRKNGEDYQVEDSQARQDVSELKSALSALDESYKDGTGVLVEEGYFSDDYKGVNNSFGTYKYKYIADENVFEMDRDETAGTKTISIGMADSGLVLAKRLVSIADYPVCKIHVETNIPQAASPYVRVMTYQSNGTTMNHNYSIALATGSNDIIIDIAQKIKDSGWSNDVYYYIELYASESYAYDFAPYIHATNYGFFTAVQAEKLNLAIRMENIDAMFGTMDDVLLDNENNIGAYPYAEHAGYPNSLNGYANTTTQHSYVTEFIPCSPGDIFWYKGIGSWAVTYTNDGALVDHLNLDSRFVHSKITVPSGVNGVRFVSQAFNADAIVFDVFKEGSNKSETVKHDDELKKINDSIVITEQNGHVDGFSSQAVHYNGTSSYHSKTTEPIKCQPGEKFYYKGAGAGQYSVIFFGDASDKTGNTGYASNDHFTEVTIPNGTEYVVFTSFAGINNDIVFELYSEKSVGWAIKYADNKTADIDSTIVEYAKRAETNPPLATKVVDGYLTQNGTYTGTNNMKSRVTEKIKCSAGDVFYYYGQCSDSVVACMWWNASGEIIGYEKPTPGGEFLQKTFVAPANADTVMFTSYISKTSADPALVVFMDKDTYNSPLTWKKWYPCGDSFTAGEFASGGITDYTFTSGRYAGRQKTYPYHIGNRTGIDIKRGSTSGATIAQYSGGTVVFSNADYTYGYKAVSDDADYVTLWFGINDSGRSIPLGNIDDTENTTFYGAWNVVLDDFTTRLTHAKIGIIISNNLSATYVDATIAIAKKWGIPYLDLNYDNSVPLMHYSLRPDASAAIKEKRNNQFAILPGTNNHPNLLAHEYESYFIEEWLKTL